MVRNLGFSFKLLTYLLIPARQVKYTGTKPYDKQFGHSDVVDIDGRFQTSQKITNLVPATDYEFKVATKAGCTGLTYTDQLKITTKIDSKFINITCQLRTINFFTQICSAWFK